jgi:hypothetical protein
MVPEGISAPYRFRVVHHWLAIRRRFEPYFIRHGSRHSCSRGYIPFPHQQNYPTSSWPTQRIIWFLSKEVLYGERTLE